jgi:hypothetical protein
VTLVARKNPMLAVLRKLSALIAKTCILWGTAVFYIIHRIPRHTGFAQNIALYDEWIITNTGNSLTHYQLFYNNHLMLRSPHNFSDLLPKFCFNRV